MTWRTAIGPKPTQTDLADDLLKAADRHGLLGWHHDLANCAIRNGDRFIDLARIRVNELPTSEEWTQLENLVA